jgi:hypothetical protein
MTVCTQTSAVGALAVAGVKVSSGDAVDRQMGARWGRSVSRKGIRLETTIGIEGAGPGGPEVQVTLQRDATSWATVPKRGGSGDVL